VYAVQRPAKKRRVIEKEHSDHVENVVEMAANPIQEGNGFDFGMNMEMDNVGGFDGDYGGMGTPDSASRLLHYTLINTTLE
jgi:hypothetical protein